MTDNNLETLEEGESGDKKHNMSDIMEAHEKEESGHKTYNEKGSNDTFATTNTASVTMSSSGKHITNLSDDQKSDSAIDEMSLLSTRFYGVNSKYVKDLQASFQSIADIACKMTKSQYSVVTRISTIVVLVS